MSHRTFNGDLAAAAREVRAKREQVENPPPFDVAAWDALAARLRRCTELGDADDAVAAIESWAADEIARLPESTS